MAIQNALRFINEIRDNDEFRNVLNNLKPTEIDLFLNQIGLPFTYDEFEDSTRYLLLRCQFEHEAMEVQEIAYWYKILVA